MKSYKDSGSIAPRILDRGEWSASGTGRFAPRERAPGTHLIGGWVGPRAGLDTVVTRKISSSSQGLNPDHPARSPALYHFAVLAPTHKVYILCI
jgi:hypothetical protein